jgi:hypothetical protein
MNTLEYTNTVQDLLDIATDVTDDFPEDGQAFGFDNIASALTVSSLLVEKYDKAAEELLDLVLAKSERQYLYEFEQQFEDVGDEGISMGDLDGSGGDWWAFWDDVPISFKFDVPQDGVWELEVRTALAYVNTQKSLLPEVDIWLDGELLSSAEYFQYAVDIPRETYEVYLDAGIHEVQVWMPDGAPLEAGVSAQINDDGAVEFTYAQLWPIMAGDYVSLGGPVNGPIPPDPPKRAALLFCDVFDDTDLGCVRDILADFARKAWRRPAGEDELDRLISLVETTIEAGDEPDVAAQAAMHAILLSPHFLFRVEEDPQPGSGQPFALNDWELATRLAYFLWSSMPDAELRELADQGALNNPDTLREQVRRMLADEERREVFVESYVGQWLHIRDVDRIERAEELYPEFNDRLRRSMRNETLSVFSRFVDDELDLRGLLDADFTYVDGELARVYELGPYTAEDLTEVQLAGSERRGILGHASVLSVNAHSTRSSPVRRGKWVLDEILCEPPPPPPPDIPELDESDAEAVGVRDALEAHSSDPACAGCHASMDPIGFSMEHFDAIGAWRDAYPEGEIDVSGELPGRGTFDGMLEMATILKNDPATPVCMTENLGIYATGHGRRSCAFEEIAADAMESGFSVQAITEAIVLSDYFLYGQGAKDDDGENP